QSVAGREVRVATFDVTAAALAAIADGEASFAIDQQPFLQGYLPIQFLALLKKHGVVPVSNVGTGPRLIRTEDARRLLGRAGTDAPSGGVSTGDAGGEAVPGNGG